MLYLEDFVRDTLELIPPSRLKEYVNEESKPNFKDVETAVNFQIRQINPDAHFNVFTSCVHDYISTHDIWVRCKFVEDGLRVLCVSPKNYFNVDTGSMEIHTLITLDESKELKIPVTFSIDVRKNGYPQIKGGYVGSPRHIAGIEKIHHHKLRERVNSLIKSHNKELSEYLIFT